MSIFSRLFGDGSHRASHPVFGQLLLVKAKRGSYWECECVADVRPLSVSVEAPGGELPTDKQVEFYQRVVGDADATFRRAAPLLVPKYEAWAKRAFPSAWRDAFALAAISIPADGQDASEWDVSFECIADKSGHLFTCYFEGGSPTEVSNDG